MTPSQPAPDRPHSHGVVEVAHHPRTLPGRGVTEAGVVGVANDSLHPGQDPSRGHGLVREVTWKQND